MRLTKNKKGVLDNFMPIIIGLVVLAVTISVCFLILAEVKGNATVSADANASKAISTTQGAMDIIPNWLPIVVITVIGAVIIGLVAMFARR